jgi:hypothetical protein
VGLGALPPAPPPLLGIPATPATPPLLLLLLLVVVGTLVVLEIPPRLPPTPPVLVTSVTAEEPSLPLSRMVAREAAVEISVEEAVVPTAGPLLTVEGGKSCLPALAEVSLTDSSDLTEGGDDESLLGGMEPMVVGESWENLGSEKKEGVLVQGTKGGARFPLPVSAP